jgi:DNA-binding transcriptional LysR family regulator
MLHSRMLIYLDQVARACSIRRAAERLGIAASSINRQILALEDEFGVRLFERMPRRMRLTAAGELLISHVRHTLREDALMRSRFIDLQGQRRGLVRIATMGGLANTLMPPLVSWMRRSLPHVKLVVRSLPLEGIVAAVIGGDCDLGLGYQLPSNPKLRLVARVDVRIGVVTAPDHPLARSARLSLADCLGYPMVIPDRSLTVGAALAEAFERTGIVMDTVIETNSIEVLKGSATHDQTVTFLSEIEVEVERKRGDLVFLPLREGAAAPQELRLVSRRAGPIDATQSRVAEELRQTLLRHRPEALG